MKQEIENVLKQALRDTQVSVKMESRELAAYINERAIVLAGAVGEKGYDLMVVAERDNVLLAAGIAGVAQADAAQARLIGILQGVLGVSAQVLAGGALL